MTTRAEIAEALTGTNILYGSPFKPSLLAQGSAWPQLDSLNRAEGFFEQVWNIFIVLPQGDQASATWWDDNLQTVADALASVVYIDSFAPVLIPAGAGPSQDGGLNAMLITARSEQ